ncbi:aspartyl protease family protein [Asticcacaulis sp.]|uniref:aspartyl protease family protein n=1 Tax=Asticcacaulis sp. TaxID=1872648 RepID=UPI003F7B5207
MNKQPDSRIPARSPACVSRRPLIGGVAAALGLCIAHRTGAQQVTSPPKDTLPEDHDAATLTARTDDADHLSIEVMINGRGPYHFVVDTGAESSVVADNVALALGLPPGASVVVDGFSRRIPARTVQVESLIFGPFQRKSLTLPVLPRQYLLADGYLGLDVISESRVTFDFAGKTLKIEQPRKRGEDHRARPGTSTRLWASGSSGRLRVSDCLVDDVRATAFIDTGAQVSVGNRALKAALALRGGLQNLGPLILNGVTGGEILSEVIPVSLIKLEDLSFTDSRLAIADVPSFDSWNVHNRPGLLIGMNFLRQFAAVTIDYRQKSIRFELTEAPPLPSPGVRINSHV